MKTNESETPAQDNIPTAEWAVAGIGLVLVCLCLGFLLCKAFFVDDGVPKISCVVEQIVPQDGGALVLAKVSNSGGETVTRLQIGAKSGEEEQSVEIDFLPARSSRKFGMFFSHIPKDGSVQFTPGSYQEP